MLHHKLLGVLFRLFQQSADRQGDTLVLGVHIGDLDLHILTLGQDILRLADAAVSDLGNVNQAVHAGENLREGTKGHQLDDLGVHNVAHGILGHELIPGVHLGGLVAQRNLVLLGVEGNDVNIDLVADLHHVSGSLDAVPAQLGNVPVNRRCR